MIETIDKNALVHYLREEIDETNEEIALLERRHTNKILNKDTYYCRLLERKYTCERWIKIVTTKNLNEGYDKHCIEKGLDRTGNRFLV